jgi:hypothetical protein
VERKEGGGRQKKGHEKTTDDVRGVCVQRACGKGRDRFGKKKVRVETDR